LLHDEGFTNGSAVNAYNNIKIIHMHTNKMSTEVHCIPLVRIHRPTISRSWCDQEATGLEQEVDTVLAFQ